MDDQRNGRTGEAEGKKKQDVFSSFNFYNVPDLTPEERKPPGFIVENMIPEGMTFLSGAPKTRKSFLSLQLAISVATGKPFFGYKTAQSDVVYLDLEGSKSRISARTAAMTTPIPRNVFITNRVNDKLSGGLVEKLRQLHREKPSIRLIIVDTYGRALGTVKATSANAYTADVSFLEPIQRMAMDEGIAVLFVHHDKKNAGFLTDSFERLSGTMGISGSADCVMNLITEGKRFDGKASLEFTPRDAKGGELKLVFDDHFGEWQALSVDSHDLSGNPVCSWLLQPDNKPERRKEGKFYSYEDLFQSAYHTYSDSPGDKIREMIEPNRDILFSDHHIGIQTGVQSHGRRGIRIINLL